MAELAEEESALSQLFTYLFLSGVSKNIIVFINFTILALILVLFTTAMAKWDARMAFHAWFQLAIAIGLLGAVNWWFSVCVAARVLLLAWIVVACARAALSLSHTHIHLHSFLPSQICQLSWGDAGAARSRSSSSSGSSRRRHSSSSSRRRRSDGGGEEEGTIAS